MRDIEVAEHVCGPDVSTLKGKTVRSPALPPVRDCAQIPREPRSTCEFVQLCADIVFINVISYIIFALRKLKS